MVAWLGWLSGCDDTIRFFLSLLGTNLHWRYMHIRWERCFFGGIDT